MTNPNALFRLVYVSRNAIGDDRTLEAEVGRILASSRRNNPQVGITGALLFSTDCFAQTLEGEVAPVEQLFERIARDSRHQDTVILQTGFADSRDFGEWSMAYAGLVPTERTRFSNLVGDGTPQQANDGAEHVLQLLRTVVHRGTGAWGGAAAATEEQRT